MTILRTCLLIFGGAFFLMSALQLVRFFNHAADIGSSQSPPCRCA